MPLILSIDTALETAGVCISEGEKLLHVQTNGTQAEHSSWLHTAIREMLKSSNMEIKDLSAVAVNAGPGSYTGLRVGMAAAKGICYALNLPLITVTSLELLAFAAKKEAAGSSLICPMIDARRMEVFTALYDHQMNEIAKASAKILEAHSFKEELDQQKIIFVGNGSIKWKNICVHPNAVFSPVTYTMHQLATIVAARFMKEEFATLAYAEPFYVKSFYTGTA